MKEFIISFNGLEIKVSANDQSEAEWNFAVALGDSLGMTFDYIDEDNYGKYMNFTKHVKFDIKEV